MKKHFFHAVRRYMYLLIASFLFIFFTLSLNAQFSPIPDTQRPSGGVGYLDNGTVKIGVDLNSGGAITYFSKSNSSTNLVNNTDKGRQLQYSFYNGPSDFAQGSTDPNWQGLGWNPIEAGDHDGYSPYVLNYANTGTTIYTKVQPYFWPLQQQSAECYFEKWITLDGNAAKIHFKITMFRSDTRFFGAHPQELPCYYGIGDYSQHVFYSGDQPFTGAPTTTVQSGSNAGEHCSENWMGIKNPNTGEVVGLWAKDIYEFQRWKIGGNSGGEFDYNATYVTTLPYIIMDHNKAYETDAAIITGTESQVRNWVLAQPRPATLPDFQFNNSRERWTYYGNVTDPGEPTGELDATITNETNWILNSPSIFYKASDLPKIYLKAKITGNITDIHFAWNRYGESSGDVVQANQYFNVPVINDGQSHVYEIDASSHPNWTGGIKGLKFFHGANSPSSTSGNIKVESVTYYNPGGCTPPSAPSLSASPSTINSGSSSTLSASGCSGGTITWSDGLGTGTSKSVSPTSTTTYTATCSIGGCTSNNGSVTVTVNGGSNPCNLVDKANIGTWYGLNVQARLHTVNGTSTWLIVTAVNGSSTDKYYPRGANFASRGDITWTNGAVSETCFGGGQTDWGGLSQPSAISTPSGYTAGAEQDGAQFFEQSCSAPSAPTLSASPSSITSGNSSTLSASGCSGGTITWSNALGTGTSKSVSPTSTTTYTATCSIGGCTSSNGSVTVTVTSGGGVNCNTLEGHYDFASCDYMYGWAYDYSSPNTSINVDLYEGSTLIQGNIAANIYRSDLQSAGKGNGVHGFQISTPASLKDGQSHTLTVKVSGCGYTLTNSPKTINGCTGGSIVVDPADPDGLNARSKGLSVYPNPNKGIFDASFYLEKDKKATIVVSDMTGRLIYRQVVTGQGSVLRQKIELANKASGTLLLQLIKDNGTEVKKLSIAR